MEVWQLVVKYMILLGFLKNQSVAEVWQLPHFPHCEKKYRNSWLLWGPAGGVAGTLFRGIGF